MCISRNNTKPVRKFTAKASCLSAGTASCIVAASDDRASITATGSAPIRPASSIDQTYQSFYTTLNDHQQAPKRQRRRNLRDECRYIDSKARHILSHAKDILDEIDAEEDEMKRQQQNEENEENIVNTAAQATQTSKICWAGKKESHFFAFGYLLDDDDDDEDRL